MITLCLNVSMIVLLKKEQEILCMIGPVHTCLVPLSLSLSVPNNEQIPLCTLLTCFDHLGR
jgi:hypothetical protein